MINSLEANTFRQIIASNPEILQDEERFADILGKAYSSDTELADAIMLLFQLEIVSDIRSADSLDKRLYFELWESLNGNYGIEKKTAQRAVSLWFHIYGEEICHKKVEIDDSDEKQEEPKNPWKA